MTTDFASRNRKASPGAAPRKKAGGNKPASPLPWFIAGLVSGIFLSGLAWLATQQTDVRAIAAATGDRATTSGEESDESPGPRFDFYTLLPQQKVDVELDEATIQAARQRPDDALFLLQAGSFKQAQDADRRRAELLLLGLDAHVEETSGDNGRWFRVYIGPFDSRSELARARGMTAQQGIDTLLLKRPKPDQG